MNRIMSTSIILLDQNFNANDVDLMVFEPSVLSPPPQFGVGGNRWHGPTEDLQTLIFSHENYSTMCSRP